MSELQCIAHKVQYGVDLRCIRPHKHKGRHRWTKDDKIYPLGRLDPDDFMDQAFVAAWNKGAAKGDASVS